MSFEQSKAHDAHSDSQQITSEGEMSVMPPALQLQASSSPVQRKEEIGPGGGAEGAGGGGEGENAETPRTTITGFGEIESYTGDFPSPFQAMWYVPEGDEIFKIFFSDEEIRGWIREAAKYHDVPHELLALIIQQENGPLGTETQKFLQFGERTLTTFAAIVDAKLFGIVPDKIAGGSSGFVNMSRATLKDAAEYTERVYDKNPLSNEVRYRIFGWDQDTRIPGDDYHADLYYAAAHIRQLIDRVTGTPGYQGELTSEQTQLVAQHYNGSGPLAQKYGRDAINLLTRASKGEDTLYFYQKEE